MKESPLQAMLVAVPDLTRLIARFDRGAPASAAHKNWGMPPRGKFLIGKFREFLDEQSSGASVMGGIMRVPFHDKAKLADGGGEFLPGVGSPVFVNLAVELRKELHGANGVDALKGYFDPEGRSRGKELAQVEVSVVDNNGFARKQGAKSRPHFGK